MTPCFEFLVTFRLALSFATFPAKALNEELLAFLKAPSHRLADLL